MELEEQKIGSRSAPLDIYYFCRIAKTRHPRCVGESRTHDKPVLIHTFRILRPPTLAGRPCSYPFPLEWVVHSDLPAVGVTDEDQIHGARNERIILGMMREQNVDARLSGEGGEPVCFRLVVRCCNRSSDAADTFLTWVTLGAAGFGTEAPVIRNISTGQASDCYFLTIDVDGSPLIIQHNHACGRQESEVLRIRHPLVVTQGNEGRGKGSTGCQEE